MCDKGTESNQNPLLKQGGFFALSETVLILCNFSIKKCASMLTHYSITLGYFQNT